MTMGAVAIYRWHIVPGDRCGGGAQSGEHPQIWIGTYPPKTRWVGLPVQRFFSLASSFPDSHRERLQASSVRASGGADERGEQLATNQRGCGRRPTSADASGDAGEFLRRQTTFLTWDASTCLSATASENTK